MKVRIGCLTGWAVMLAAAGGAPLESVSLPEMAVELPRVANQEPVATFAMPVSGLRFEPRLDVQARNLAEAQADVSVQGGIFENTGFRVGALPLYDPQTGHYFVEIPIAPAMLGPAGVLTGADHARWGWNATAGTVAYAWRPIRSGGQVLAGAGQYGLRRADVYLAHAGESGRSGWGLGADVALAHSRSDGSIPWGDHEFTRYTARLQLTGPASQTDLVAGYQAKFLGWPNLYTPFQSRESDNLQTVLVMLNHHVRGQAAGDYVQIGAYYRRLKDDYAFDRFAPVGPVHPFQHTTWVYGAAVEGRRSGPRGWALLYRGAYLADELESTSLTFGRFDTRRYAQVGLFAEKRFPAEAEAEWVLTTGAAYDDTNRDASALSPQIAVAREMVQGPWRRWHLSYAKSTQVPTYTALNAAPEAGLFRGQATLSRSAGHHLETGLRGSIGGWETEATLFFRRDDRLVDWTFQRGVTARQANAVDIDTLGVELFARRHFGPLELMLGYAALRKQADYGLNEVDASFYALNFPRHRLTAGFIVRWGQGWEVRWDNEVRLQEDNPLRTRGGDEAVLSSLALGWSPPALRGLSVWWQVDNLWDSSFEEVPAVPAARRQWALSAQYRW